MVESLILLRNKKLELIYKYLIKPIAFKIDPEKVHEIFTFIGKISGSNFVTRQIFRVLYYYKNYKLEQNILGLKFENPIGLAAGFDYEAKLTQILPEIGFGFNTIGSVTLKYYEGNTKPRLGRLPKSKSLLVNKGLKSEGSKKVIKSLENLKFKIPLGISVAKTNCKATADEKCGIDDVIQSLKLWEKSGIGSYYELNISCPNSFGGESFAEPKSLNNLLKETNKLKIKKPIFLKMPVDITEKQTDELLKIAKKYNVQGVIFGNLTKDRTNPSFDKEEILNATKGNFSGMPTQERADNLIKFTYKKYKDDFIIVGCGGVFTAEDAYKKIKLGASLVQMITGMIFQGPQTISQINQGLVNILEKDGYKNISEAIGKDN